MLQKIIIGACALCVLLVGGWYFFFRNDGLRETAVYTTDTTIEGDLTLLSGEQTTLEHGARLTVNGDLTVDGGLTCRDGALNVTVAGAVTINGGLSCEGDGGITLVTNGALTVSEQAEILSHGSVQVTNDASGLATTDTEIEALYNETGENAGTGTRIGPMVEGGQVSVGSDGMSSFTIAANAQEGNISGGFMPVAHAQEARDKEGNVVPGIVIGGKWIIGEGGAPPSGVDVPTPDKKIKKVILNFDFGPNGDVALRQFHLVGPKGRSGESDSGTSCNARGKDGEDAFRFRVHAKNLVLDEFRLELGDGGDGGIAETSNDCDPGVARGGKGGEAGNFKMTAEGTIAIASFHIVPGRGGSGGDATAYGKNGENACPGKKGGDATATGGDGGKNKKELAAAGAVTGIGNVTIDAVVGGSGGAATARPGRGGNGTACKCDGGAGGKGTATAGKGGDASLSGIAGTSEGGNGGDADSHGGVGGSGGSCQVNEPTGGKGGKGGDAKSTFGVGGTGAVRGTDGEIQDETGGDGGNGGDGCGPGNGGKGGAGDPPGSDGAKGKLICTEEEKPKTSPDSGGTGVVPGGGTQTGGGTSGGASAGGTPPRETVQVIRYQGKYLPVDQLIIEDEIGCGAEHWHAAQGIVVATDGSQVFDPGPQCGFGKVRDIPVEQVMVPQ